MVPQAAAGIAFRGKAVACGRYMAPASASAVIAMALPRAPIMVTSFLASSATPRSPQPAGLCDTFEQDEHATRSSCDIDTEHRLFYMSYMLKSFASQCVCLL